MSQSNVIFAFIFIAYLAFITLRGELPKYAGFLLLAPKGGTNTAANPAPTNTAGNNSDLANVASITGDISKVALLLA